MVCFFSIPLHAVKAGKNSSVNAAARNILLLLLSLGITNVDDIGMLLIHLSSFGHDHSVIASIILPPKMFAERSCAGNQFTVDCRVSDQFTVCCRRSLNHPFVAVEAAFILNFTARKCLGFAIPFVPVLL